MRSALGRVDVVRKAEDRLLVGAVPLHRDLGLTVLGLALEVDDLPVDRLLVLVQVRDEVPDAALVAELDALAGAALVDQLDPQALGEESRLPHALGEGLEVEVGRVHDLEVGKKRDRRPGRGVLRKRRPLLELADRHAPLVGLRPHVPVPAHLEVEALGERVDDGDADAVQAARDLVAAAVAELAAGVEHGQDDLGRRALLLLVHVDRDAAAVVADRDAIVRMQNDLDGVAVAGERLVDGVVDDLVDEMVEPALTRRADVHTGSLANGLEAFEDGDVGGVVTRAGPLRTTLLLPGIVLPGRTFTRPVFWQRKTSESRSGQVPRKIARAAVKKRFARGCRAPKSVCEW